MLKLPCAAEAIIDDRKLKEYILSFEHPIGRFKAAFFASLGFYEDNWDKLDLEIRRLAQSHEAEIAGRTSYGQKYLVRGRIEGERGRSANIVTVWIVRVGEERPRFVTAYPEDRG